MKTKLCNLKFKEIKINLDNNLVLEPSKQSTIEYLFSVLLIIIILHLMNFGAIWYFVFLGLETVVFFWLETTYYRNEIPKDDYK